MPEDNTAQEGERELIIYDFNPYNLPPEYLNAIGLVAMASASTEAALGDFIGAALNIDSIEMLALTTHMANPLKDHVARALTEMNAVSAEVLDQIDDLLDAIKDAMDKRNAILHNELAIHPKTKQIFSHRMKARGSLQLELRPISVEEIQEDARLINKVGLDLIEFMALHNLAPRHRTRPLWEPLDRSKKARAKRRETNYGKAI